VTTSKAYQRLFRDLSEEAFSKLKKDCSGFWQDSIKLMAKYKTHVVMKGMTFTSHPGGMVLWYRLLQPLQLVARSNPAMLKGCSLKKKKKKNLRFTYIIGPFLFLGLSKPSSRFGI
jgi:hypothetical protein